MPKSPESDGEERCLTTEERKQRATRGAQGYAKYSGVAIQMIVILLLFVYGGRWLDANYNADGTMYTVILSMLGIALALYVPLKGLMK